MDLILSKSWMIAGFTLSLISIIRNDSLQTLGPFLLANQSLVPKRWQMIFLCTVSVVVLMLGWILNGGDPAWGRLNVPGHVFTQPTIFTWVYLIPPLAMLLLAQWGAPLSTSFLVLSKFEFKNSSSLIQISLFGYLIAFLYRFFSTGLGSGSSSDGFLIRINQIIRWGQFGLLRIC